MKFFKIIILTALLLGVETLKAQTLTEALAEFNSMFDNIKPKTGFLLTKGLISTQSSEKYVLQKDNSSSAGDRKF